MLFLLVKQPVQFINESFFWVHNSSLNEWNSSTTQSLLTHSESGLMVWLVISRTAILVIFNSWTTWIFQKNQLIRKPNLNYSFTNQTKLNWFTKPGWMICSQIGLNQSSCSSLFQSYTVCLICNEQQSYITLSEKKIMKAVTGAVPFQKVRFCPF